MTLYQFLRAYRQAVWDFTQTKWIIRAVLGAAQQVELSIEGPNEPEVRQIGYLRIDDVEGRDLVHGIDAHNMAPYAFVTLVNDVIDNAGEPLK